MDKEKMNARELTEKELEQVVGGAYLGASVADGTPVAIVDWCDCFVHAGANGEGAKPRCGSCVYARPAQKKGSFVCYREWTLNSQTAHKL